MSGHFIYSGTVNFLPRHPAAEPSTARGRNGECTLRRSLTTAIVAMLCHLPLVGFAADDPRAEQRVAFVTAWASAREGDRESFRHALDHSQGYLLYPYLQYEDLRHRRASVPESEMSSFIEAHRDWPFTPALETAWLRTLGDRQRWDAVLQYGGVSQDSEVRCHFAHARIQRGLTDGLKPVAQGLWTVGKSQVDACDPVFTWLRKQPDGITSGLAWERIKLAMQARERRLARYVARFLDTDQQVWAERWYQQDRAGYRRLVQANRWPVSDKTVDISNFGLRRLARNDPDRAWEIFAALDGRVGWSQEVRGALVAELALWSAVNRSEYTPSRIQAVETAFRDDRLLEWTARFYLAESDWAGAATAIEQMTPGLQDDSRWRYWAARAKLELEGKTAGRPDMAELAQRATFYGFLAADHLGLPYRICPESPAVVDADVAGLYGEPGIERALELRRAGLANWARSEWQGVVRHLDDDGLRAAAAIATREDWPDMAIAALGNSGDLRWYVWRFPLAYEPLVRREADRSGLDPSWVMGLMRSESALAEDAISHAGARGLMQITPHTATQLSRRHGLAYSGRAQLLEAETNVRFGTTYLRELMERFNGNPVLVSGAYNAGPRAVDRWLEDGYTGDPAAWIDTLPYFETRDYIPRVLAFATIYEWRFGEPVKRLSARMPPIGMDGKAGNGAPPATTDVACDVAGQ